MKTKTQKQMKQTQPKEGALRVWWIPQIPMTPFYINVETIKEAKLLLSVLVDYDAFQYAHKVKPDYSNVGGLQVLEDGEWSDWYDTNGDSIDEVMQNEEV